MFNGSVLVVFTDHISVKGNAIVRVRPSVRSFVSTLYLELTDV